MNQTIPVPLSNAEQIVNKIEELKTLLQTGAPGYEGLLHTIHVALHKDPDTAHILTEEQIGIIVSGLSKRKGVIIQAATSKQKTSDGKKLKDITADDI